MPVTDENLDKAPRVANVSTHLSDLSSRQGEQRPRSKRCVVLGPYVRAFIGGCLVALR